MMPRRLLGSSEDREDDNTRTRIDELVSSLMAWQEKVDQRYRRVVAYVMVSIVLGFGAAVGCLALLHRTNGQATSNTVALCALRRDLEVRVDAGEKFIEAHPNGVAGITVNDIKLTTDGQKRTIKALSGLECPQP